MKKAIPILLALLMMLQLAGCTRQNTVEVFKCYYCGEKNPITAKFCNACGKSLGGAASQHPPEGSSTGKTEEQTSLPKNESYVMQNSGDTRLHYGTNVCVDGEIIYLGYRGTFYVFCGNEVTTYASGGTSVAELQLYNGYVYYTNQYGTVYRLNVSNGEREILLSDIGIVQESFLRKNLLFLCTKIDEKYDAVYVLNLDTLKSSLIVREDDEAISWISPHALRETDTHFYLEIGAFDQNNQNELLYYKIHGADLAITRASAQEYDGATAAPTDDGNAWTYYISGNKNLCRKHKTTETTEILVQGGSGMRNEGETVAKTYGADEVLYADDRFILFRRFRMADGLEYSIWMVDADGNNLNELIRKEYYGVEPIVFPNGAPGGGSSGGTGGGGGSGGENGETVGNKTCMLCGGDGRVTCYYCKGSKKGPTIYIMGIPTEQGCTYCGSSGWRVCSGCGGYGVK